MTCKKVSFTDEKFANDYLKKLHKTSSREIKPVRAYLCEHCLCWHLTSIRSEEQNEVIYLRRQVANLKQTIVELKKHMSIN